MDSGVSTKDIDIDIREVDGVIPSFTHPHPPLHSTKDCGCCTLFLDKRLCASGFPKFFLPRLFNYIQCVLLC